MTGASHHYDTIPMRKFFFICSWAGNIEVTQHSAKQNSDSSEKTSGHVKSVG